MNTLQQQNSSCINNNNASIGGAVASSVSAASVDTTSSQLSHVIKDIESLNMANHHHHSHHHHQSAAYSYLCSTTVGAGARKTSTTSIMSASVAASSSSSAIRHQQQQQQQDTFCKDSGVQSVTGGDLDSDSDGAMTTTSSSTTTTGNGTNASSSSSAALTLNQILASAASSSSSSTASSVLVALKDLTELIKAGNSHATRMDENFKRVLHFLFDHLDTWTGYYKENQLDQAIATQTLLALRELIQFQYAEFAHYVELTIKKLVDKYRESPASELYKLVEDVCYTAARCLPADACARVLRPMIETAEYPKNLIAIRMMQKSIDHMSYDVCTRMLPEIMGALLLAWDSQHSAIRKASVFCLVSLYMIVGEELRAHMKNLSASKVKYPTKMLINY